MRPLHSPCSIPAHRNDCHKDIHNRNLERKKCDKMANRVEEVHPISLSDFPHDIIEEIAERLCYPIYRTADAAGFFLSEGYTTFSTARFHLSAFSSVCRSLRPTVERWLYRDIHVDNVGWISPSRRTWTTSKHHAWPAASLPLLLRTLDARPDLRHHIRGVYLRWCDDSIDSMQPYTDLRQFLERCPQLCRISFSELTESLLQRALTGLPPRITTLSASCAAKYMDEIVSLFPRLQDLQLTLHGSINSKLTTLKVHNLIRFSVKLDVEMRMLPALCQRVLAIAGNTVEDLCIEATRIKATERFPALPLINKTTCQKVRYLCLKNINSINKLETERPSFSEMSSLRHLHLICSQNLPSHAFMYLPSGIRSISFSLYGLNPNKTSERSKSDFVLSIVDCLSASSLRLAGVKTYGAIPGDSWELGNLLPLKSLCRAEKVSFVEIGAYADSIPVLIIFFRPS